MSASSNMADGGFKMDDAAFDDALDDLADGAEEGPDAYEETSFIDPVPFGAERAEGRAGPTTRTPAGSRR